MKDRDYIINLYEIYKELLTEKQKEYFEYYYYEDLSLSEISGNVNVSRAIINKTVNTVVDKILNYEKVLEVYKTKKVLRSLTKENIDKEIKQKLEELL